MKTCSLKIVTSKDEKGEDHINAETIALLLEFSEHRKLCDYCGTAFAQGDGRLYCATGLGLWDRIVERPDVEVIVNEP